MLYIHTKCYYTEQMFVTFVFSISLVWVPFSAALSLDNFFILGLRGVPLATVGFIWTLEWDRAAYVACADPLNVP